MSPGAEKQGFGRRKFLGAALGMGTALAGGSVLLSSCSNSAPASTGKPLSDGISSLPPKPGGKLVFGIDSEVAGFNPSVSPWSPSGVNYARALFDPLAILMADGTVRPYLAQSITPNTDYTVWTITMRPGVVFHDGTPCDAKAVAYNLDHFRQSEFVVFLTNMSKVTVTGPLTLEVQMNEPWVPFPALLTGSVGAQVGWISAPSMLKSKTGAAHPIGTGPFKFVEWIPNDHMIATKNVHYWRKGLPYLDEIEYKPITSSASRSNSLQSGALDIMMDATTQVMVEYMHNPHYSYIDTSHVNIGEPGVNFIMLNTKKPPFDNLLARQALAYGTDLETFNKVVANSLPQLVTGLFPPGNPYHTPTGYPTFDAKKAAALVKQYESTTGKPLAFTYTATSGNTTESEIGQLFQSMWQTAGMKVNLTYVEEAVLIQNAINHSFQASSWAQFSAPDPDCNWAFWHYPSLTNFPSNNDPEINHYLHVGRTNSDPTTRKYAYQAISKRLAADLPYIWTNSDLFAIMARPGVMNFNAPTSPDGGKALGLKNGVIWPTQIWIDGGLSG